MRPRVGEQTPPANVRVVVEPVPAQVQELITGGVRTALIRAGALREDAPADDLAGCSRG